MDTKDFIIQDGLKFLVIKEFNANVLRNIEQSDAVIIEYAAKRTYNILKLVRSHHHPLISLIPVIILFDESEFNRLGVSISSPVKIVSDFIIDNLKQLSKVTDEIKSIAEANVRFINNPLTHNIELVNTLRFIISRKKFLNKLNLLVNNKSIIGYEYPIVEFQFKKDDYTSVFQMLSHAVEQGVLTTTYRDTVHLCPNCLSGFHNIKEVCPSCGSGDLESESTIHHFVCANISPKSEYLTSSGDLLCPQCDRYLKNIGIDYDKPSYIYHCNSCDYSFQDPDMSSFCFNCQQTTNVLDLKEIRIYDYEITKQGVYYAYSGKGLTDESGGEIVKDGYISHNTFNTLYKLEKRKAMQLDTELITAVFIIRTKADISESIYNDLCEEIKSITPEYVSIYEKNRKFIFLFPNSVLFDDMTALYQYNAEHIKNWLRDKGIITSIKSSITSLKNEGRITHKI